MKPFFDQRRINKNFKKGFHKKWFSKLGFQRFGNVHFVKRNFNYRCFTCNKPGHFARNCNLNFQNSGRNYFNERFVNWKPHHQGPNLAWVPKRS